LSWAASTAAREAKQKDSEIIAIRVAASQTFYKGDIVVIDAASGLAKPCGGNTPGDGDMFAGVAIENFTSTATAVTDTDGSTAVSYGTVRVATVGSFEFDCANLATASVGKIAYGEVANNAHTASVTIGTSHKPILGICTWVNLASSATKCRVRITGCALNPIGYVST
jgi:hypothetical protein